MLAVEFAANYNVVLMEQPDYNTAFEALTSGLIVPKDISDEFEQKSPSKTVPLDHVKVTLLDSLIDQLILVRGQDMTSTAADIDGKLFELSRNLQREVQYIDGLSPGDTIIATGDAAIILADEKDGSLGFTGLSDNIQLRGNFECVIATHIAAHHTIATIQDIENDTYDEEHPLPLTKAPGITLWITDAVLIDQSGEALPIDEEFTVLIPMNYPSLRLSKLA